MNSVVLIGRLSNDGKYTETTDGMQIYKMTVAVDREFKKEGGQTADFIGVTVFGKQAENCEKYLSKGKMVGVRGRIQTGSYTNKEGKTVYTTEVIADRVEFLSPKGGEPTETTDSFAAINEAVPF